MKKRIYMLCLATVCLFSGCGSVTKQPEVTERVEDKKENDEILIKKAIACIKEKKYPQAMGLLMKTNGNAQAEELLEQLRYLLSGTYFANLDVGVAAIDNNGKVQLAMDPASEIYDDYAECKKWKNIVSLSEAGLWLNGLDRDGKIHLTRDIDPDSKEIRAQLKSYKNIAKMDTEWDNYVILSRTGKVYTYSPKYDFAVKDYKEQIDALTDVVDVVTGQIMMATLQRNGTVYVANYDKPVDGKIETDSDDKEEDSMFAILDHDGTDTLYDEVSEWTDIVDISGIGGPIAGLKSDGTVVISSWNINGDIDEVPSEVSKWKDIIAISNAGNSILGLKRDGTVVAAGDNEYGQSDVSDWKDIVAIATGDRISFGLKSDGTLVMAGTIEDGFKKPDLSKMKNLYVPTIQYEQYENTEK